VDSITAEKENNLKAIISDKHQFPSKMRRGLESEIYDIAMNLPPEMRPVNGRSDIMTWSFVGGSLDPNNQTLKNSLFFFAMEPRKLLTIKDGKTISMMDGIDELTPAELRALNAAIDEMERNPKAVVIGADKLKLMEKKVGDRFRLPRTNYPGMELDFEIIAEFPSESRYAHSAVMNRDYFYRAVDELERKNGKVDVSDICLNLIWIRLPTKESFKTMAAEVNKTGRFTPAIKMETASTAFAPFLAPYQDLFWGMRYVLSPMIVVIITLVIAIAVSIGVRERRTEMAVLKVIGFRPWQVLALVLGEALLVGIISGTISTTLIYLQINYMGGLPFKIAFFPKFMLTKEVLLWGPLIGSIASFVGSIVPAWTTHRIKAAEVFSRVT
jgi:putative ABC transport system permease protein